MRKIGVHSKAISDIMGHEKWMPVYAHSEVEEDRAPLAKMAAKLNPIEPTKESAA